jgi:uncharacterized protein (TIGR02118 family)
MVKIVFCLRRKPGLSPQEFQDYWRTRHAPLVQERAQSLGIRRYVQSHTLYDPRLNGLAEQRGFVGEPFDGVAELWFDSGEVLHANPNAPAASLQAAKDLLTDEGNFIDLANSPILVAREIEILVEVKKV